MTGRRADRRSDGGEEGSAIVDFVLVGALVTVVFMSIVQLAITLHIRNTLIDAATEGARYGAREGAGPQAGARRARELITSDLSGRYARDVTAGTERTDGLDVVVVRVRAPLPVMGLIGVGSALDVSGHAWLEQP